ncbi:MAG: hypothetical protein IJY32_08700, partial [Mogibacterium sp.]|nr:hypothetical protein [Mogibacterium sp.]
LNRNRMLRKGMILIRSIFMPAAREFVIQSFWYFVQCRKALTYERKQSENQRVSRISKDGKGEDNGPL